MDTYDRNGIPIDLTEFGRLASDETVWRVARSKVTDAADMSVSFDVSTVWLGVDHNHGDGPPVIFETMVFDEGSNQELLARRYCTEQQAKDGHVIVTMEVAARLTDPVVMDAVRD